ncbi:MAG TPA: hypothetical protein VGO67_14510 [Verrucomicrobiae bacterium]
MAQLVFMVHSGGDAAYWVPLFVQSAKSSWNAVIEHTTLSLVAVVAIDLLKFLWKNKTDVLVNIPSRWSQRAGYFWKILWGEKKPIVIITSGAFSIVFLFYFLISTPRTMSLEAASKSQMAIEKYGSEGVS